MQKAHLNLINYVLSSGCKISVWDGVGVVHKSTSYDEIIEAIEAVEEAEINIYKDSESIGWARIIFDWNQTPDEIVADYTCTPFMEAWNKQYTKLCYDAA